jgi:KipI family sensor histidine kinase inhibitor
MSDLSVRIEALADSALLAQFGDAAIIDPARAATVARIAQGIIDRALPGVLDVIPSYATILVEFDLITADIPAIEQAIGEATAAVEHGAGAPLRRVTIPVCYGGELGPDLDELAAAKRISAGEIVALHSGASYLVAVMGFSPGWAYLLGLPEALTVPRRSSPRVRVPAGSVATAGGQTGIYSQPTPGGWWLLGRTPARMFDLERADPFLLHAGDEVRFMPISPEEYATIADDIARGELGATIELLEGEHAR